MDSLKIVLGGLTRVNAEKAMARLLSTPEPVVTAATPNPDLIHQKLDDLSLASVVAASASNAGSEEPKVRGLRPAISYPPIIGTPILNRLLDVGPGQLLVQSALGQLRNLRI